MKPPGPLRRTPLARKTPPKKSQVPLKRTQLRQKSKKSPRRRQLEAMQHDTPKGVPFEHVREHLPERVSDWKPIVRILDKPAERRKYLKEMQDRGCRCRLCPVNYMQPVTEVHHLTGGSKGRADERCNFLAVCSECHEKVQSQPKEYRRVWLAKWIQDAPGCDWVRLIQLLGRWPEFDSLD